MEVGLQEQWLSDIGQLQNAEQSQVSVFDHIISLHSEKHRRYHGVGHLKALFRLLHRHSGARDGAPEHFAVWWHDAIYDPAASDNEERSAQLAAEHLQALGASQQVIADVQALILATKRHWDAPPMGAGDYFLDADIAILGSSPEIYDQYAEDVRAEYAFVNDVAYRFGRSKFLSNAMSRSQLFRTPVFEAGYGQQARINLQRELTRLGNS